MYDKLKEPIYHTNVAMSLLKDHAVICLESIIDLEQRKNTIKELSKNYDIIDISLDEVNNFCGNVIMGENGSGEHHVIMSERAYNGFSNQNIKELRENYNITYSNLETIEKVGGGGARCMLS